MYLIQKQQPLRYIILVNNRKLENVINRLSIETVRECGI